MWRLHVKILYISCYTETHNNVKLNGKLKFNGNPLGNLFWTFYYMDSTKQNWNKNELITTGTKCNRIVYGRGEKEYRVTIHTDIIFIYN